MSLRALARRLRAESLERLGRNRAARLRLDGTRAALLCYHRVLPHAEARARCVEPGMVVSPETFARHLDWLVSEFRVLPLREVVERLLGGRPLPPRACAISFDDGWLDNLHFALPALCARDLPASVFVVAERIGTEGAFWPDAVSRRLAALPPGERAGCVASLGVAPGTDPLQALLAHLKRAGGSERSACLERLAERTPEPPPLGRELLDWDEVAQLAAGGVSIESHGARHVILPGVPLEQAEQDLRRARELLAERGYAAPLLAYPSGEHDARVRQLARELGHRAAVTTEMGLAALGADPWRLPRLGLHEDVSASRAEFLYRVPGPWAVSSPAGAADGGASASATPGSGSGGSSDS